MRPRPAASRGKKIRERARPLASGSGTITAGVQLALSLT